MTTDFTVVFLYTELAAYTVACLNRASKAGVEVHVVRWPVNQEAPFEFSADDELRLYNRSDYTSEELTKLVSNLNPDLLLISGWVDKSYLQIGSKFRNKIPVVLLLDNPWKGNLKQWLAASLGRLKINRTYTHCWVPGKRQRTYARRLGFSSDHIQTGFYSADLSHFEKLYEKTFQSRRNNFPKRFLYVGRYVDFKGIHELWQAFIEFREEHNSEWELWCVGTGEEYDTRIESEGIKHFGFLQPAQLESVIAECCVFILPSRKEPWGVVVHEFAAAGFPLICSSEVGAAEVFLKSGENGYLHSPGSVEEIKKALLQMASETDDKLIQMAEKSHELSLNISPETWTNQLLSFLPNKM